MHLLKKEIFFGNVNFYIDGSLIQKVNLVAENDILKKNLLNTFEYISSLWFNVLK